MKQFRIVWRPSARDDLLNLYDWIAAQADPDTAFAYTAAIEEFADQLSTFPHRGAPRDDLSAGMRTVAYRRRTVIGYRVLDDCVEVLGLVHGGQEWDVEGI